LSGGARAKQQKNDLASRIREVPHIESVSDSQITIADVNGDVQLKAELDDDSHKAFRDAVVNHGGDASSELLQAHFHSVRQNARLDRWESFLEDQEAWREESVNQLQSMIGEEIEEANEARGEAATMADFTMKLNQWSCDTDASARSLFALASDIAERASCLHARFKKHRDELNRTAGTLRAKAEVELNDAARVDRVAEQEFAVARREEEAARDTSARIESTMRSSANALRTTELEEDVAERHWRVIRYFHDHRAECKHENARLASRHELLAVKTERLRHTVDYEQSQVQELRRILQDESEAYHSAKRGSESLRRELSDLSGIARWTRVIQPRGI